MPLPFGLAEAGQFETTSIVALASSIGQRTCITRNCARAGNRAAGACLASATSLVWAPTSLAFPAEAGAYTAAAGAAFRSLFRHAYGHASVQCQGKGSI